MGMEGIGISNLPNLAYKVALYKKMNFNIMVLGSSGLGKSTFINELTGIEIKNPYLNSKEVSLMNLEMNKNKKLDYLINKEENKLKINKKQVENDWYSNYLLNFQETKVIFEEKGFKLSFNIYEVDNIGEQINNTKSIIPIKNFINLKNEEFFNNEIKNVRKLIQDCRIHCCIYFFEASGSGLTEIDLKIMNELSKIVNLIPILSKSDTYTSEEKEILKNNFMIKKSFNGLHFYSQKNREYPWGVNDTPENEILNQIIKKISIDLIDKTEDFYLTFKRKKITEQLIEDVASKDNQEEKNF